MPGLNPQQTIAPGIPALIAIGQSQEQPAFLLDRLCVLVGDQEGCDLRLLSGGVAPAHALIITAIDGVYVRNLTGQADLLVNGQPILIHRFVEGDLFQVAQFTFKFWSNQAIFQPPMAPVPAAIECNGVWPIQARIPLIGNRAGIDLHIDEPSISPCHAAIFAAGGVWHIRDLNSQAGVFVDNAKVRQGELRAGNIVRMGNVQMRWLTGAQAATPPAPTSAPSPEPVDSGLVLGGMPVSLPQVAPPKGFGRVGVTFEGKSLAQSLAPPPPIPGPTLPDLAAIENKMDASRAELAEAGALPSVRTPVLRNFPPVPKLKSVDADENDQGGGVGGEESGASSREYFSARSDFGMEISGGADSSAFAAAVSSPAPMRDAFGGGEGIESPFVSDAAFGGQSLGGDATNYVPDSQDDMSETYSAEIEDFSENKFWDLTDEQQLDVPLPQREIDLTPAIPPVSAASTGGIVADPIGSVPLPGQTDVAGATSTGESALPGDVFGKMPTEAIADFSAETRTGRAKSPPAQERLPSRPTEDLNPSDVEAASFAAPLNGEARYGRPRTPKVPAPALVAAVIIGMAAVAGATYLLVPARSVVEGRLSFLNVPPDGTPDRQALIDDQRRRLADASLEDAAATALAQTHSDVAAGFLRDATQFNGVVSSSHFEDQGTSGVDLVLRANGSDSSSDSERMAQLLETIYERDADLKAAAAAAQGQLADWQPNIDAKQAEVDDSQRSIADQQALIAAGQKLRATVADLQSSAKDAQDQYTTDLRSIIADQTRLNELTARLEAQSETPDTTKPSVTPGETAASAAKAATTQPNAPAVAAADATQPATQPSTDGELADLEGQVQVISDQVKSLEAAGSDDAVTRAHKIVLEIGDQLNHDLAAHADILQAHPELKISVAGAQVLNQRLGELTDQMVKQRQHAREFEDLGRLTERTARQRTRAIYDADPQLRQLQSDLDVARATFVAVNAFDSNASDDERADAQVTLEQVQQELISRQRELTPRPATTLRDRLDRLISTSRHQADDAQQVVAETTQTLIAQMEATPPIVMAVEQRDAGYRIAQELMLLARAQNDYAATIAAEGNSSAQLLLSLREQRDDLQAQADARRAVVEAQPVTGDDERRQVTAERDALAVKIPGEVGAMESDAGAFSDRTLAAIDADLQLQAAEEAQHALPALMAARDAKLGDLAAMKQSRDQLLATVQTTPDVKHPSVAESVRIISDTADLKAEVPAAAALVVGVLLSLGAWRMRHRPRALLPVVEPALQT